MKLHQSLKYRSDFPILNRLINGKRFAYLDNAATSQVPTQVLDALFDFETKHRANVHRGVHTLSDEASNMYDEARKKVASFVKAVIPDEVIFTSGATDSLNLVALAWGKRNLKKDDIVLISEIEHHSNFVPWQEVCKEVGAILKFIPISDSGALDIKNVNVDWAKVRFVSFTHISNVIGKINNVKDIVKYIKKRVGDKGEMPRILVDGSQSIAHIPVNVQKLGIDFYAFSGHKMYGPMGIGVLWVNRNVFDELSPAKFGGGMINEVTFEKSTYAKMPESFEAGTPNVSGAIGLGVACDYLSSIGMENVMKHDNELTKYALDRLGEDSDTIIYGVPDSGVISFNVKNIPSHDLATVLDSYGVAVRSGHHCVMPWHKKQSITSTVRMSFAIYSGNDDVDQLMHGINKAKELFL